VSTLISLPITEIKPYEGNPRVITDADVERVKVSIETYGYQAPIIVDADNTIVVGHTRFQALQRLGFENVMVIRTDLPAAKAREYRVVDNRAAELVQWDRNLLIPELREFVNTEHLALFFPDIDLSIEFSNEGFEIDQADLDAAQESLDKRLKDTRKLKSRVIECPECERQFTVSVG
jgi:ParB-like chromosome segregation protein Spo0J